MCLNDKYVKQNCPKCDKTVFGTLQLRTIEQKCQCRPKTVNCEKGKCSTTYYIHVSQHGFSCKCGNKFWAGKKTRAKTN